MVLIVLLVLSRSDCFTKDEVEGKIASVLMEAVGPDHVFVERDMVRNKYWLGL